MTSFHARHCELLANLQTPWILEELMDRAQKRDGRHVSSSWSIVWSRVVDPKRSQVRLVLAAKGRTQRYCSIDIGGASSGSDIVRHPLLGQVRMTWFPTDDGLPTLREVLQHNRGARVVRYRPGKRCTLAFRNRYIKVFNTDKVDRFHGEGQALWSASLAGELDFAVAPSLGSDTAMRTHTQGAVAGQPLVGDLYSADGEALAERLGRACASIPCSSLAPTVDLSASSELARTQQRGIEVRSYVPELGDEIERFIGRLQQLHGRFEDAPLRAIHGSPHPNQWLLEGDVLGLVDFDRLSFGDPELDVATFLGEVDFESSPYSAEVAAAFVEGYQQRHKTLDSNRLTAYRAHKRFAKVYRTVRSIRHDADRRAAAHLALAWDTFGSEVLR